ncbi:glycosyltransferase family 2 protein [Devosia sp.]|uniref:glycosyltransferase family 2 protein n=1 Tax=Devosia sp. TaxID=1871048 RepID=UPI002F07B7A0
MTWRRHQQEERCSSRDSGCHPDSSVPLITIGVTCHNAANTIERAVDSALRQAWPNTEIVVVDDASTDGSWPLIEHMARADARVRALRHATNRGYPAALNTILKEARGDYVAFFDDDDDSVPGRLAAQHERLSAYEQQVGPALILCYANRLVVEAGADTADHVALAIGRSAPEPHGPRVADFVLGLGADPGYVWGMLGSCTLMARRETFAAIGPFDEDFRRCAEWDLAVRAAIRGGHFIAVDSPLVTQYKTISPDKTGDAPLRYAIMLRRKHRQQLNSPITYIASCAAAFARHHGSAGHKWRSRAYLAAACLLSPTLLAFTLHRRRHP